MDEPSDTRFSDNYGVAYESIIFDLGTMTGSVRLSRQGFYRYTDVSAFFSSVGLVCAFDGTWLSRDEIVLHVANHFIGWQHLGDSTASNL